MEIESRPPHHEKLELKNFTAFKEASFQFSPTVNALVGANGTGKTHVMKALFTWQLMQSAERNKGWPQLAGDVFQVDNFADLVRLGAADEARVSGVYGNEGWDESWTRTSSQAGMVGPEGGWPTTREGVGRPVFVPAVDMLGHTRAFASTYDNYKIDFDLTHRDIVSLLLSPERRNGSAEKSLMERLQNELGGDLSLDGERFYLSTRGGRLPIPAVAEGLRKVATLVQLAKNGFLGSGSTLFWDEPEVNLNPILMDEVVAAILALARNGAQVFLATHSYVILKELDLQSGRQDGVRFFGFSAGNDGTSVQATSDFAELDPNPILDQYDSLFSRDAARAVAAARD